MVTRCLLVSENDLITAGVRNALAPFTDLVVYSYAINTKEGIQRVTKDIQPDVIILDEHTHIAQFAGFLQLLKYLTQLRIVLINHEDNSLNVYQGKHFEVLEASDLGYILRNPPPNMEVT